MFTGTPRLGLRAKNFSLSDVYPETSLYESSGSPDANDTNTFDFGVEKILTSSI